MDGKLGRPRCENQYRVKGSVENMLQDAMFSVVLRGLHLLQADAKATDVDPR